MKTNLLEEAENFDWQCEDGGPLAEDLVDLIKQLAIALQPFADLADAWDTNRLCGVDDRVYTKGTAHLRLSDCKKARSVLEEANL